MDFYEKNLALCAETHPALYERLITERSHPDMRIELYPSGPSLIFNGRRIEPRTDPAADAYRVWTSAGLKGPAILVHLGLGLGSSLLWYLSQVPLQAKAIYVVERELEVVRAAFTARDLRPILMDPRVRFFVGGTPVEIASRLFSDMHHHELIYFAESVDFFGTELEILTDFQYYDSVRTQVNIQMEHMVFTCGNNLEDDFNGFANTLDNAENIGLSFRSQALRDQFKGVPGLVVAAGPSLNKNIHRIPEVKDRCLIFAVERMVEPLLKLGVEPDFVIALEREKSVAELLRGLPPLPRSYLVAFPVILRESIDLYNGPVILMKRPLSFYRWLPQANDIVSGTLSAGNLAFIVATYFGCDPVVLVGQDLSYDFESRRSHVEGTRAIGRYDNMSPEEVEKQWGALFDWPGNLGKSVKVDVMFRACVMNYQNYIALYRRERPDFRVINATEGGALIEGTEVRSLADVIAKDLTSDVSAHRARIQTLLSENKAKDNANFIPDLERLAQEAMPGFDEAISAFQEGLAVIEENRTKIESESTRLVELNRIIERIIEAKLKVFRPDNPFNELFFGLFGGHHSSFELRINALRSGAEDNLSLKRNFIMLHERYFRELVKYLTLSRSRLEEFISRPKVNQRLFEPDQNRTFVGQSMSTKGAKLG